VEQRAGVNIDSCMITLQQLGDVEKIVISDQWLVIGDFGRYIIIIILTEKTTYVYIVTILLL